MDSNLVILTISFFFIALIYSSVGFGGGSSYLALLGQPFFYLEQSEIRPIALFCNIIVVTGGTIIFYRDGKLDFRDLWPYVILSVPMAILGGYWRLNDHTFFILLGCVLALAAILLWLQPEKVEEQNSSPAKFEHKLLLGGALGLLSGLVSIGGGIFLSPILHFLRWLDTKRISALASFFILVNSIGGLIGQFSRGTPGLEWGFLLPLLLSVLIGGQIGSRLGAKKFEPVYIKRITAVLILLAAINIIRDHL